MGHASRVVVRYFTCGRERSDIRIDGIDIAPFLLSFHAVKLARIITQDATPEYTQ